MTDDKTPLNKNRIGFFLIFSGLIYLSLFYLVNFFSEIEISLPLPLMILGGIIYTISLSVRGLRYQLIINSSHKKKNHRLKYSISGVFVAWGLNSFVPGRLGEISRLYVAKKFDQVETEDALDSIILEKIFDFLIIGIIGLGSFFVILRNYNSIENDTRYLLILSLLIGVVIMMIVIILKLEHLVPIFEKIPRIGSLVTKLMNIIQVKAILIFSDMRLLSKIIFLSLVVWLLDISIFVIMLYSIQYIAPEIAIFTGIIGFLTFIFPILPNAAGQFEGTVGLILSTFGFPFILGFTAALMDHVLKVVVAIILGVIVLVLVTGNEILITRKEDIVTNIQEDSIE